MVLFLILPVSMLHSVVQGITMGLVLSTFIGPIFFMLIDLGINHSLKYVFYLALATFLSDLTTILILQFVASEFIREYEKSTILYIIGGSILVYLGIHNIYKSRTEIKRKAISGVSLQTVFIKGFAVNFLNPTIFFFWVGAIIASFNTYNNNTFLILTHFISGLVIVFSSDYLKGYLAFQLRHFLTPRIITIIGNLSGVIIIGYGIKLIFFH